MKPVVETMDGEQVSEASGGALGRAYEDLVGELKRDWMESNPQLYSMTMFPRLVSPTHAS